jgi:molybdate transport system substrate-binding protein
MRFSKNLFLVVLVFTLACGCTPESKKPDILLTAVAPDYLKGILDPVVFQFHEESGVRVNIIYENPDSVISRAKSGLRADLFLSPNPKRFKILKNDTQLVGGPYSCPFRLSLVLVGRIDGPQTDKIDNLKQDEFRRVVLVEPTSGFEGKMAAKVLNRRRLWDKLLKKMILARSTEHLHSYLSTGEADAAIMLESSLRGTDGLVVMQRLDEWLDDRLVICGAVTGHSKNKEVAQAFLDLLESSLCPIYKTGGIYQYSGR